METKIPIRLNIFDSKDFQVSLLIDEFLDDLLISRPEDFNIFRGKLKYFWRETKIFLAGVRRLSEKSSNRQTTYLLVV